MTFDALIDQRVKGRSRTHSASVRGLRHSRIAVGEGVCEPSSTAAGSFFSKRPVYELFNHAKLRLTIYAPNPGAGLNVMSECGKPKTYIGSCDRG